MGAILKTMLTECLKAETKELLPQRVNQAQKKKKKNPTLSPLPYNEAQRQQA